MMLPLSRGLRRTPLDRPRKSKADPSSRKSIRDADPAPAKSGFPPLVQRPRGKRDDNGPRMRDEIFRKIRISMN